MLEKHMPEKPTGVLLILPVILMPAILTRDKAMRVNRIRQVILTREILMQVSLTARLIPTREQVMTVRHIRPEVLTRERHTPAILTRVILIPEIRTLEIHIQPVRHTAQVHIPLKHTRDRLMRPELTPLLLASDSQGQIRLPHLYRLLYQATDVNLI